MILALVGNQNSGKTTLFNALTGSNQHVGNFPGVTVDQKSGEVKGQKDCTVVDLPGVYSIRPYSAEEIVTRDFIMKSKPDGIINIVDATNIERNLYLTLQLLTMKIPTVVALNMMDEVRGNGGSIDIKKLSGHLGVPVVPISAAKDQGISELIDRVCTTVKGGVKPARQDFCPDGAIHRCIHSVSHVVEDHAARLGFPSRFAATKLIEEDGEIRDALGLSENELELIEHSVFEMENEAGLDRNAAIAKMRYDYIEKVCEDAVHKPEVSRERLRSDRIDAVLTHRIFGLPIFFGIMFLVFYLTFGLIGQPLADLFGMGIDALAGVVDRALVSYGINPMVHSLIIDGIFAGVGNVLTFLPLIVVLFFFLSILEDTGYMARVAFVMDKLLRKIGLSGKSFVPMLIGFGCTVPAIMATRTLSSERDRKLTVMLTPFMSCSAKIPIYALFAAAFFPRYAAVVMIVLYIVGIAVGILMALLLRRTAYKGEPIPFVMELPNYRMPSPRSVGLLLWEKAKDFLVRAFTIIFISTIAVWFLQHFDTRLNVVGIEGAVSTRDSLLVVIGSLIAPVFAPLGFGTTEAATALISGLTAKESVISTLCVLTGTTMEGLGAALAGLFTPMAAVSFLVFTLLYTPCFASIAAVKKELNTKSAATMVVLQLVTAWIMSALVYNIGMLIVG